VRGGDSGHERAVLLHFASLSGINPQHEAN